jgi:hypothetical protein
MLAAAASNNFVKPFPPPPSVREARAPETSGFPPPPAPSATAAKTPGETATSKPNTDTAAAPPDLPPLAKPEKPAPLGGDDRGDISSRERPAGYNMNALLGIMTASLAVIAISCVIAVVFFRTRIASLEKEIQETKYELAKANVNLATIVRAVEELSIEGQIHSPETIAGAATGQMRPQPVREELEFRPQRARGSGARG